MNNRDTKLKVVSEEEVNGKDLEKLRNTRTIIKGILKSFYDDKFSNFLLSSGLLYMVYAGIVEEYYIVSVLYGIAFLRFADFKKAYHYVKELSTEYNSMKENIKEEYLIEGEKFFTELNSEEKKDLINKK